MRWFALALLLPLAALAGNGGEGAPSNQSLVFFNARVALREDRPNDVLKLWLLRNSLEQRGEASAHDADFRSVVWAALGDLALCQDGFAEDQDGAGLWPIALHNWVALSISKGPPPTTPAPFDVFDVGRQQRFVSLHDVLSAEELRSVEFFRTGCLRPRLTLIGLGEAPWAQLDDRLNAGRIMRHLLERSKETLAREKVQSFAAIDARLFDLELALAELYARRARTAGRMASQEARSLGVSRRGASELQAAVTRWPEGSRQTKFLRSTLSWSADEWLSLSRERRLFLFAQAQTAAQQHDVVEGRVLAVVDALIGKKEGAEVESWLGFLDGENRHAVRKAVTAGERGKRLLELDSESGFRERAVVSLHRGVAFLEAGELHESLRSFAFALKHAEKSRASEVTRALSRRWLSYVLAHFETTHEVIGTLKELVPRQEYNAVIEDLLWRAALRADAKSFERVATSSRRGGALDARISRLESLAKGRPGAMATKLREQLEEEPYSVLRFLGELVEMIESEDGDVRRANIPTMKLVLQVIEPVLATGRDGRPSAHARTADELLRRTQAILDGLDELDVSEAGRSRALSPAHATFAGAIRVAPTDPLPWPFSPPITQAPSAFTRLILQPVEWRDSSGERVFGWRIHE